MIACEELSNCGRLPNLKSAANSQDMATTIEHPDTLARSLGQVRKAQEAGELLGEQLTLNMGPSHPATHGVLRLVLELDGEIITKATPDVGYLHRGDEKIAENMHYNQFVPVHGPAGLPRAARQQRRLRAGGGEADGLGTSAARPGHPRDLLRAGPHLRAPARRRRASRWMSAR